MDTDLRKLVANYEAQHRAMEHLFPYLEEILVSALTLRDTVVAISGTGLGCLVVMERDNSWHHYARISFYDIMFIMII